MGAKQKEVDFSFAKVEVIYVVYCFLLMYGGNSYNVDSLQFKDYYFLWLSHNQFKVRKMTDKKTHFMDHKVH